VRCNYGNDKYEMMIYSENALQKNMDKSRKSRPVFVMRQQQGVSPTTLA
jgi:hypothetical protein